MNEVVVFTKSILEVISIYFVFTMLNTKQRFSALYLIIYALILGLISVVIDYYDTPYHMIFSIVVTELVFVAFLKKDILNLMIDVLFSIGILTMLQLIVTAVCSLFIRDFLDNEWVIIVLLIAILIICIFLSFFPATRHFFEKYYAHNRNIVFLVSVSIVFLIIVITDVLYYQPDILDEGKQSILIIVIAYFIVVISMMFSLIMAKNQKHRADLIFKYGEYLETVNKELRRIEHETRGHMQIIQALCEQGDTGTLQTYISDLIEHGSQPINISYIRDNTYVSAFLHNSSKIAEELSIRYVINISDNLSGYKIASHDLVDILINLINNAFEAVIHLSKEKRIVHIDFFEQSIEVRNIISQDVMKTDLTNFCVDGYSTKGIDRGLGLGNVITIAQKYDAELSNYLDNGYYISVIAFKEEAIN